MATTGLHGGFATPSHDAARAFRAAMQAMARPGRIETLAGASPPAPLSVAAGVLVLTLCDSETPLYLAGTCDTRQVRDWIAFHTGAPLTGAADCAFALGRWADLQPVGAYRIGTPDYPDRSATLIVEMERIGPDGPALCGPGIAGQVTLSLPDPRLPRLSGAAFPLGIDCFLTAGAQVAAVPRSTRLASPEGS